MSRVTSRRDTGRDTRVLRDLPPAAVLRRFEIAWTVAACVLGPGAGQREGQRIVGVPGDVELVWVVDETPRVEVKTGGRVVDVAGLPKHVFRVEERHDDGLTHVRVVDDRGSCWLDATVRLDEMSGVLYARTRVFQALGLGGGRYSAPELRVR